MPLNDTPLFTGQRNNGSEFTMKNFWNKINKKGFRAPGIKTRCWIWIAATDGRGYGVFHIPMTTGSVKKAYRVSYELKNGPIPKGLELDHLCRIRLCVNPNHLEAVTHRENVLRGSSFMAAKAKQTHCIHGHEYTKQNTGTHHGRRYCKACTKTPKARENGKLRMRKHREKKKIENMI